MSQRLKILKKSVKPCSSNSMTRDGPTPHNLKPALWAKMVSWSSTTTCLTKCLARRPASKNRSKRRGIKWISASWRRSS